MDHLLWVGCRDGCEGEYVVGVERGTVGSLLGLAEGCVDGGLVG